MSFYIKSLTQNKKKPTCVVVRKMRKSKKKKTTCAFAPLALARIALMEKKTFIDIFNFCRNV